MVTFSMIRWLVWAWWGGLVATGLAAVPDLDPALAASQQAIGVQLADHRLTDSRGMPRTLSQWRGKPVVISLIYTSCYHVCSIATRHLAEVVAKARQALGEESFTVLTIGFDSRHDSPAAMASYARKQEVDDPRWFFLSADETTIARLIGEVGFSWQPSPKGFDHLIQATVVDGEGVVYRQVYGETFDTPQLVEPLKELVLGRPKPNEPMLAELSRRIRFFCTTYDPATGAYRFDYSLFVGMAIGGSIILIVAFLLWREWRKIPASRQS